MSIYSTWLSLSDDDHKEGCAVYVEDPPGSGIFEFSGKPCDCGIPRAPYVYQGSHVLPQDADRRAGEVQVAAIPNHVERDHSPEGARKDWLRLSVHSQPGDTIYEGKPYVPGGDATVVLSRPLVEELRDTLSAWLDADERS